MPLSGLWQGFKEAQLLEADVKNRDALAQERLGVAKAQAHKLARETAELDVMKQIFGSTPQAAQAINEDDPQYINQLEMAGRALMKVNPVSGMTMLGKANAIKKTQLEATRAAAKEKADEAAVIGAGLSAVTDQDSYNLFLADLAAKGKETPRGLTGDYSRDQSRIAYYAKAAMSTEKQALADYRATSAEVKLQDLIRKTEASTANAAISQKQAELAEQRLKLAREREEARRHEADRNFASKQQGKEIKPLTRLDREQAQSVVASREDLNLPSTAMRTVADTIAARAKKRAKGDPENYQEYLDEELDKLIESGELKIPKKKLTDPTTWFAKPEFKPERGTASDSMEGQESLSKSGKPIVFRNGRWEYK